MNIWKDHKILAGHFTFEELGKVIPKGYRLPTEEEFKNLIETTEYEWDEENCDGVFTFKDGFQLVLPLLGYMTSITDILIDRSKITFPEWRSEKLLAGLFGYYWSGTVETAQLHGGEMTRKSYLNCRLVDAAVCITLDDVHKYSVIYIKG